MAAIVTEMGLKVVSRSSGDRKAIRLVAMIDRGPLTLLSKRYDVVLQ